MAGPYQSFSEFYPFYLSEHRNPANRRMHFLGTTVGVVAVVIAILGFNFWWLLAGMLAGYACAWFGHFMYEKNQPATFKYPLYSFIGDWVMYKDILTGKIKLF